MYCTFAVSPPTALPILSVIADQLRAMSAKANAVDADLRGPGGSVQKARGETPADDGEASCG
jgi:hypothetical protein